MTAVPTLRGLDPGRAAAGPYPVTDWDPPFCGHSGMAIDREGAWFHDGRPIGRPEMVRLFAQLLRRESDGRHMLVTPVEKLAIDVADAPLMAVELSSKGAGPSRSLSFRIGATGDWVRADADHPIFVEAGPRPYLTLDAGLRARIARPVFHTLAELALEEGGESGGLWSHGAFMSLLERC
jgi:hypothetical protein